MSILVKGMMMPNSCLECMLHMCGRINEWDIFCNFTHKRVGKFDDKKWNNGWRSSRCPLTEVPTPHGRLVDIDEVYRVLSKQYHHTTDLQHTALREALAKGPTVLEAEGGEDDEHTD